MYTGVGGHQYGVLGTKASELAKRSSFSFQGKHGHLNLLGEARARGSDRLTLLSAPAGSGKTTLLAQWLAA